jgi:hypothetical protein
MDGRSAAAGMIRHLAGRATDRSAMTRSDRPPSSRLRTLLAAVDVVDLVAGVNLRHAGAVIVMMAVALVGVAFLFAVLALTGVVLVVFGLTTGPFAWLGSAVLLAGVIVGFGGSAILMFRIIRRRSALTVLTGFREPDDGAVDDAPARPSPVVAPRGLMTTERMRALDARHAAPGPSIEPALGAPVEPVEPGS